MRKKVPYDRVGTADPAMPVGTPPDAVPQAPPAPPQMQAPLGGIESAGGGMDLSQMAPQQQGAPAIDLASLGADQGPDVLAGLQGQDQGQPDLSQGDDTAIQDMLDAVANPETPPEIRDAINAEIALAARRRLMGAGGLS